MVKKITKKEKKLKQFSVFHMAGESLNRTNCDSYNVIAIDARSPITNEYMLFPVVYAIKDEDDATHMIPFTSVVDLVQNYGFEDDVAHYKKEFEKLKEEKESKKEEIKKSEVHRDRDVT